MSYPGNTALSSEVQQQVLHSFEQMLGLVSRGDEREAREACELLLGLDPAFGPATVLLERLNDPARPVALEDLAAITITAPDDGPILTADDLWEEGPLAAAPIQESSEAFSALPDLESLDAGSAPRAQAPAAGQAATAAAPGAAMPAAGGGGLGVVLQDLLDRGEDAKVLQIATNQRAAVDADPELAAMVTKAQTRMETRQYVRSFLDAARRAQAAGKPEEAKRLAAKARILDPDSPEVAAFDQASEVAPTADPGPAARDTSVSGDADEGLPGLLRDPLSGDLPAVDLEASGDAFSAGDLELELGAAPIAPAAAAAPEPPAPTTDLSEGGEEGGDRIDALLAEGQESLEKGEIQGAIDIWSRIFLIDIDNQEASNRIEKARERKAEAERKADEVFHEAMAQVESGELQAAATALKRVLELQPGHAMASEYLEQIQGGQVPAGSGASDVETASMPKLDAAPPVEEDAAPSLEAAVQRDRVVAVKGTDRRLVLIGGLVLLLLLAGAFGLYRLRDRVFPNAAQEQGAPTVSSPQLARAAMLFKRGKTATAIQVLEAVASDDPAHAQAQALLTQYRAAAAAPPEAEPVEDSASLPTASDQRRSMLLEAAKGAFAASQSVRAHRYLNRAADIAPLDGEALKLSQDVDLALAPIASELESFEHAEWEQVLPDLWRQHDEDPGNPDLRLLIADCYYNLGLRSLQRGTPDDAVAMLQAALEVEPDNEAMQRMLSFAETYSVRPQDLLYRIYVKYLPQRQ